MNVLRFAVVGFFVFAGSMFANIVSVSAAPQVTTCESSKLGILVGELKKTGLLSEHRRFKSGCLKYDGDAFETFLIYLGDFSSSDLQKYLPKLPIDHGQKIVLDDLTLVYAAPLSKGPVHDGLAPGDVKKALGLSKNP